MPVIYDPPDFNLLASMWTPGSFPASDPPALTDLPCQKYIHSRISGGSAAITQVNIQLRLPSGTITIATVNQTFEVPQGSGCYFRNLHTYMQHEGFPNEYIMLLCAPSNGSGFLTQGRTNP